MGQLLDEPVVEKDSETKINKFLNVGVASMQGFRISMEDKHYVGLDEQLFDKRKQSMNDYGNKEQPEPSAPIEGAKEDEGKKVVEPNLKYHYFAVFDGHSGSKSAIYCAKNLAPFVRNAEKTRMRSVISSNGGKVPEYPKGLFSDGNATAKSYVDFDNNFKVRTIEMSQIDPHSSGTTCISCALVPHKSSNSELEGPDFYELIVYNVGDSRCILYDQGKVVAMSHDHKPTDKVEMSRIQAAGGYVEFNRVNGSLALSRAFGDFAFKKNEKLKPKDQIVSPEPTVKRYKIEFASRVTGGEGVDGGVKKKKSDDFAFVVLACDGIWDVMSNDAVCKFVRDRLIAQKKGTYVSERDKYVRKAYSKLSEQLDFKAMNELAKKEMKRVVESGCKYSTKLIMEDLIDNCVLVNDSKDNCSALMILFRYE